MNSLKQEKRLAKKLAREEKLVKNKKRAVVCLKYGTKYSPEFVNKLFNMVKRNLTLEHDFICFTENSQGIDKQITIQPLPTGLGLTGWWFKPLFFNPTLLPNTTMLYLDLDMIIFKNIDYLFTYEPDNFCIIRDFNRYLIKDYKKFNSSVFRLDSGQHSNVYHDFMKDHAKIIKRYHGDQDWIRDCIKQNYMYWPDEWIQSYKWEMRGKPRMTVGKDGRRNWTTPGEPNIKPDTSIAVFHGEPNPDTCIDPWCMQNWY